MIKKLLVILQFVLPIALWIVLSRPFFSEHNIITSENFYIYSILKFYFDNLRTGVFPLWNPFITWGAPTYIYFSYIGVFNPVWILMPTLNFMGLRIYESFLATATLYFLIGQLGFYMLARVVLKDRLAAFAAFLLYLFSSLSLSLFIQYHPPLVYIPSLWFFYFLLSFWRSPRKKNFVGMIVCLMLIASTYVPFYFLTVFLLFLVCAGTVYSRQIGPVCRMTGLFLKRHKWLAVAGFLACGLALGPGLRAYQGTLTHEVVNPARGEKADVYEKGAALKEYHQTAFGALSERMALSDCFAYLDDIQYGDDGFIYLSFFAYILLAFGAFLNVRRETVVCFSMAFVLLLLMLTNVTPLHRFFWEHIFFFKLIRNMHFFQAYFLAALILPIGGWCGQLLAGRANALGGKKKAVTITVLLHLAGAVLLMRLGNIILSTYVVLVLGAVFFLLLFILERPLSAFWKGAMIFLLIVIQPVEVFLSHHAKGHGYGDFIRTVIDTPPVKPAFAFKRPLSLPGEESDQENNSYFSWYRMAMRDSPGFFMKNQTGFPLKWSYFIAREIPRRAFHQYVRFKLYLYDRVALLDEDNLPLKEITESFRPARNIAFVHAGPDAAAVREGLKDLTRAPIKADRLAQAVTAETPGFRVKHFDVNALRLEADVPEEKFLVYTDSYHRQWQCFVDGMRIPIYRTNLAFKGIRLPAGRHEVYFRYQSVLDWALALTLSGLLLIGMVYLIFLYVRDNADEGLSG